LRLAIHRFKYQNARILARPLAEAMAVRLKAPDTLTLLVPVPLHYKRLRERGYNQSELLSVELAGRFKLEVDHAALERVLNTFPQARIPDAGERHRNLAGAFAVRSSQIKGRSVIIVDDVCTTGATLESCAAALRQSGAVSVHAWTLAREV
jgi:ComF family protein